MGLPVVLIYFFLGLAGLWALTAVREFFALAGNADQAETALAFLAMAAVNLGVAWFLYIRKERRERARR